MRRKKGNPKGVKIRGAEGECGVISERTGKPCEAPKILGQETCRHHKAFAEMKRNQKAVKTFLEEERKIETLDDCATLLAECINHVRLGVMPTDTGRSIAQMMDKLIKVKVFALKYDPKQIAARVVTREMAAKYAQEMSIEDAKRIVQERNSLLYLDRKQKEEVPIIKVGTPEAASAVKKATDSLNRLEKTVESEMDALREVCDIDTLMNEELDIEQEVETEDE